VTPEKKEKDLPRPAQDVDEIRRRFAEAAGHVTQSFGAGRVLGQVFAHVYFSRQPQTLDDLTRVLGISKGSASMAVRQLEQWSAFRRVWIKGDRKDYYEATDEFGRIIRKAVVDMVGRNMEVAEGLLEDAGEAVKLRESDGSLSDPEWAFLKHRLLLIQVFRDRVRRLWDSSLFAMFMK
jgi:DNA-binding transcriptional regulator GbsR (MarR family)